MLPLRLRRYVISPMLLAVTPCFAIAFATLPLFIDTDTLSADTIAAMPLLLLTLPFATCRRHCSLLIRRFVAFATDAAVTDDDYATG